MVITDITTRPPSLEVRGTVGKPNGLGFHFMGFSLVGDDNRFTGVFQRRRSRKGQVVVKMRHYYPIDTATMKKAIWRKYHGDLIKYWQFLTATQKEKLRKDGIKYSRSGINRLCTEYSQKKPLELGGNIIGYSQLGNLNYFYNV